MMHASDGHTISFGKHRGQTFVEVATKNSKYCDWALEQPNPGGALQEFVRYLHESGRGSGSQSAAPKASDNRQTKAPKKKPMPPEFCNMVTAQQPVHADHFASDLQFSQNRWVTGTSPSENADPNGMEQNWSHGATPSFCSNALSGNDPSCPGPQFEQWPAQPVEAPRFPGQPITSDFSGAPGGPQSFAASGLRNYFSPLEQQSGPPQGAFMHGNVQQNTHLGAPGQFQQLDQQSSGQSYQPQAQHFQQAVPQVASGQFQQLDQQSSGQSYQQQVQHFQQAVPQVASGQFQQLDQQSSGPYQQPQVHQNQHFQQAVPQSAAQFQQLQMQGLQQNQNFQPFLQGANQPHNQQSYQAPASHVMDSLDQFAFNPNCSTSAPPGPAPTLSHAQYRPYVAPTQSASSTQPHAQYRPTIPQSAPSHTPPYMPPTQSAPSTSGPLDLRKCTFSVEPYERELFKITNSATLPQDVFAKISQLPGANKHCGGWIFPVSEYKNVVQFLRKNPDFLVQVEESPRWVLQCIPEYQNQVPKPKIKSSILEKDGESDFPGVNVAEHLANRRSYGEDKALMPYQVEAVMFGVRNGGRVLIGDEMGLGKTVEALTLASVYIDEWPCLVVVPSSVRCMWRDEALEWVNITPEEITLVKSGKQQVQPTARFVVVSYDMLARNESLHVRSDGRPYQVVILDECHYIKNRESQRARATIKIAQNAKRAILLSGTPSLNQAAEMFTQFLALMPGSCPTFKEFADRFCDKVDMWFNGKGKGKMTTQYRGSKRGPELNVMLKNTIMIRRLKSEVLTQLPKKRRQKVKLETKPCDLKELKAMMTANGIGDDMMDFMDCLPESTNSVGELFQATTRAKLPAVHEYVEYLVNVGCKFIIFAHHHFCIDEIESKVKDLKVDYIRIDGRIVGQERENRVRRFNEGGLDVPVAILSITACGQGMNLQSCSTVVFAEMYWVPGQLIQAEDRVHRLGQQASSVNIHYLVVPESIDDIMYNILCKKHKELSVMLDGEEKTLRAANVSSMGDIEIQRQKEVQAQSRPTEPVYGFPTINLDANSPQAESHADPARGRKKRASGAGLDHDPKQQRIDSFFKRKTKGNASVGQFGSKDLF